MMSGSSRKAAGDRGLVRVDVQASRAGGMVLGTSSNAAVPIEILWKCTK